MTAQADVMDAFVRVSQERSDLLVQLGVTQLELAAARRTINEQTERIRSLEQLLRWPA